MKTEPKIDLKAHDIVDICMDSDDVAALPQIIKGFEDLAAGRSKPAGEVFDRLKAKYRAMQ
jgi:hypothetical protein